MSDTKLVRRILLVLFVLGALLTWAPWLDNAVVHANVLATKGKIDGSIDKAGQLVCDYTVYLFPLGRWVASCEAGYFVAFWGSVL